MAMPKNRGPRAVIGVGAVGLGILAWRTRRRGSKLRLKVEGPPGLVIAGAATDR